MALKYTLSFLLLISGMDIHSQDSRSGYWFPVKDTLRILLVYAELVNDPNDPGNIRGWGAGTIPPDPGNLFDHQLMPGVEPQGFITKYYYQASFGKYIVLADHYPEIVSIDYSKVRGRGFDQVLNIMESNDADDIITEHGYSVNNGDFDFISTSNIGRPKKTEPDSLIDIVMVRWRVNSKITKDFSAGFCFPRKKMYTMKAMKGMNSSSYFVNSDYTQYSIILHEFSHLLLGGNNFHTGGAGAGTKTFMSDVGGYAMLSSYLRSSPVYCSFDRRRLGWKHPDHEFQISARDPLNRTEIDADLSYGQEFSHGSNEFILRDFVQTGDAIRVELPYLNIYSEEVNKQWLWLENHQKVNGNIDHEKNTRKGLYAYIQVGKETLSGSGTFRGNCNYTWPVSAFGNFDFLVNEETRDYLVNDSLSNPFTGYNNLILGAYDLKDHDELIYRNEVFLAKNIKFNGTYPDSSNFNYQTYPLFGTSMDAFQPGDKIGIERNPAAVPVLTYRTSGSPSTRPRLPVLSDNRMIHLNGISVEFLEQLPDGSIKLRIRWDDNHIGRDVRWCGNIHLHESLEIDKKVRLLLDLGLTPQKPKDPILFKGQQIFADSSSLVLQPGSNLVLGKKSRLVVDNGSTLILLEGSEIEIGPRARIIIEPGARIRTSDGASIKGRGIIILKEGAAAMISKDSSLAARIKTGNK